MPTRLSSISVIIVNYNTRDDLRACLNALIVSPLPPDQRQIIVVDNASSDGSADMVRADFPTVQLLNPGKNLWFCGGNNLGLDHARGDYALLLNPDTVPPPDALSALVNFLDAHPDYAGATMQLRYPAVTGGTESRPVTGIAAAGGVIQRTCSRAPSFAYLLLANTPFGLLLPTLKRRADAHHWYAGWERDRDFDVEAMPGSCACFRRQADGSFPRLNAALRLYFPEDDLAHRLRGQKFRFLAAPGILHREKSSTNNANARRLYFRDLIVYTRTHHGVAGAALIWLLSRPLLWAILWRSRQSLHSCSTP